MTKKKIRKPLAKMQPTTNANTAPLPGNAGNPKAAMQNSQPRTGAAGFMAKKKLLAKASA